MTQKKALNQLEEYCRVNNMHLINSTFIKGAYALVIHDAPGEWVQGCGKHALPPFERIFNPERAAFVA